MRIRDIRNPSDLKFPFRQSFRRGPVSFEVLSGANTEFFKRSTQKWLNISKFDLDISYLQGTWKPFIEKHTEAGDNHIKGEEAHHIIYLARTKRQVEGFIQMGLLNSQPAALHFIGVAPWNMGHQRIAPFYPGISTDLMRISFLISLQFAKHSEETDDAFRCYFVTERGRKFAHRLFSISGDVLDSFVINVNKSGVQAFLNNDMGSFHSNSNISTEPYLTENMPKISIKELIKQRWK